MSLADGLGRRSRRSEMLIRAFLFLTATLSIFTTVGIVYELGKESISFFTRQHWEDINKQLAEDIGPEDSMFEVDVSGRDLRVGEIIRIGREVMEVQAIEGQIITVERGSQGTVSTSHKAGLDIFRGNRVNLVAFFTQTEWAPQIGRFGILPLLSATLMTSTVAMVVALPLGLSIAIYLSEYASLRARNILKPVLEILAGIPTVVYGYFALTFVTPLLRGIIGENVVDIYNTLSAGMVIGILVIPLVSSMSEDALSAVPDTLRQAAYGLGATRLEAAVKVVVPAAFSGIAAAFIVAASRAIGETMIVAIAAGAGPNFTFNPFKAAETMTGHIVRISGGDLSYDSIDYNSIFAIGLVLFFITLILNFISQRVVHKFREVYE
jgi:phosphate transport system permease protein